MYTVQMARSARLVFEGAGAGLQRKLDRCFSALATDPRRHNNVKALKGRFAGYWRFRVGDHRVIYRIDDVAKLVTVLDIADRKDVYE